jgi:DNA topoisomerase-1
MTQLIIAEKPKVAAKIAFSIGRATKKSRAGVPYYEVDADGKKVLVASAVGHVYTLQEKGNEKWNLNYPVFNLHWVPIYEAEKAVEYTKKYIDNIKELAREADSFVNSCDYDVEGSVIGANVLRFACGVDLDKDNIKRMHFSTITTPDLRHAYENMEDFDRGQTEAGLTRHVLDWYYGINLSRALTSALRKTRARGTLSIGRVQGPALKLIVDREREISKFVPEPYWVISALMNYEKKDFEAVHEQEKFWEEGAAKEVYDRVREAKKGSVKSVDKKQYQHPAPNPFDLTSLQLEAHRYHGIPPKETLEIGQTLYEAGLISYPRTSSQQLPPQIGYKNIIERLSQQPDYKPLSDLLLKESYLKPNNGKKTDPAHPAIYPTGEKPEGLAKSEEQVYDLIVHRFMATFGKPAIRESMRVGIDVNGETFVAEGKRTVEKNWHILYGPYAVFDEILLPNLEKNKDVGVDKVDLSKKMTQPPKRYSQASIISELEKRNLGTKCVEHETLIYLKQNGKIRKIPIGKFVNNELKASENVKKIGKKVLALCCDIKNRQTLWKPIKSVSRRTLDEGELKEIVASDLSIKLTGEHPVAILGEGGIEFKEAKNLKPGDKVIRVRNTKWDPKSRVIANMIGDGSISIRKDIRIKTPDMRYHNKDIHLINIFSSAADSAFSAGTIIRKASRGRYYVSIPLVTGRKILRQYPEIENGEFPEHIDRLTAIGAFFDDEGCVYLEQIKKYKDIQSSGIPKIKLAQKHKTPLEQISNWLKNVGISSRIYKTYVNYRGSKREYYELWVRGRGNLERFMLIIPFFHKEKFAKLMLGLSRYPSVLKKAHILRTISLHRSIHDSDLSKLLGLSLTHARNLCRELEADGLIQIERIPNLARWNANNSLVLKEIVPYGDTFYSRLKDTCLTSEITASTISEVRDAWSPNKLVYDITIDTTTPNFIAGSGNFLVHNSTRAVIIDTLYKRGYIDGKQIQATELGIKTVDTLEKHSPEILDEQLTREFEEDMEEVMAGKKKGEEIERGSEKILVKILDKFKEEESEIGEELKESLAKTEEKRMEAESLGKCPECGGELIVRVNPKTRKRFLGCGNYPKCTNTQPLPQRGLIKPAGKICSECGYPIINVWTKGKKVPWTICTNIKCPTKNKK